jgi:hypothetical protein
MCIWQVLWAEKFLFLYLHCISNRCNFYP